MKKYILIVILYSFTVTHAQNDSVYTSLPRLYVTPTANYNWSGFGIKLNLGYNISNHFSIELSSGYMTNSDNERNHKFIPITLGLKYNLNVFRVQSYIFYQAGWNFLLKGDDFYNVSNTNSSLGGGFGVGVLIRVTKTLQIDILYSFYKIADPEISINSLGLGLNYRIK